MMLRPVIFILLLAIIAIDNISLNRYRSALSQQESISSGSAADLEKVYALEQWYQSRCPVLLQKVIILNRAYSDTQDTCIRALDKILAAAPKEGM